MQKNFRLDSLDSRLVPVLHRADLHTRTHNPQVQSETAWNRQSHLLHYPRTNAVRRRPSQRSRCPRRTRASSVSSVARSGVSSEMYLFSKVPASSVETFMAMVRPFCGGDQEARRVAEMAILLARENELAIVSQ